MQKYEPSEKAKQQLDNNFVYHPPKEDQLERYAILRSMFKILAAEIIAQSPPSREQSIALTELESAMMWTNAAIARNE